MEGSGGAQPPEDDSTPDPLDRALGRLFEKHDVRRLRRGGVAADRRWTRATPLTRRHVVGRALGTVCAVQSVPGLRTGDDA